MTEWIVPGRLATHIAAFKVPARIWVVTDQLPRLGTEKIDKVCLRERYRGEWARERGG